MHQSAYKRINAQMLRIHTDFSQRIIVTPDDYQWIASPQTGVERVMLYREGDEAARATSLVRYAPNSHFPHHTHPEGEEILVLEGVFSEAKDDYEAGWYMRNPPGSAHQPASKEGALIFVKLRQMPIEERTSVRINTRDAKQWQRTSDRATCLLFSSYYEQVYLQALDSNTALSKLPLSRLEILLLAGSLYVDGISYAKGSWIRLADHDHARIVSGSEGAQMYIRTGARLA